MSDYIYPVELIKKTKLRIQKQLDGNGVNPKDIEFDVKRQGLGVFGAQTRYELDAAVKTTHSKGKIVKGQLVDNTQIQTEIKNIISDLGEGDTIDTMAKEAIKNLPLRGFGAHTQLIPLKGQEQTLTEHSACGRCSGQGQSQCQQCQGRGQMQCILCHSRGYIRCLYCQGQGQQSQNGNAMQPCVQCQGRGEVFCTQCHGQKLTPCTQCQTRGITSCSDCDGQGLNSTHHVISPSLKISSDIMIVDLEDEPKIFASKVGAMNLAKGGHISIKDDIKPPITEEVEIAYFEEEPEDTTKNTVFYEAEMPWAVAYLTLSKTDYKIALVGSKGAVAQSQHFMDDIMQNSIKLMQQAANGDGFVAGLLKDACEYRVSRETLSSVVKYGPKKSMAEISKLYAIGLSKPTLQGFVKNTYSALKRVTRRPRYIGLGVGLIGASIVNYLWFINGERDFIVTGQPVNMQYLFDISPFIIGLLLCVFTIKGAGYITYQSVLRDIGIKSKKMPAMGTAGIYGFVGNLVLWSGFFANHYFNIY